MMKNRPFWKNAIEDLFKEKSIVWLTGVRRAGKTFQYPERNFQDWIDAFWAKDIYEDEIECVSKKGVLRRSKGIHGEINL